MNTIPDSLSPPPLDGDRYKADVPDTLDLADRAELAINAVTGAIKTDLDYEFTWRVSLSPFKITNHACQWFSSTTQGLEVLSLMRTVTGSRYNLDIEQGMISSLLSRMGEDGLVYNAPYRPETPWRNGGAEYARKGKWRTDEDVCQIISPALVAIAFMERYERDQDPALLKLAEKIVGRLAEIAIDKGEYAYYPSGSLGGYQQGGLEFSYYRNTGWPDTSEASDEMDSAEGAVTAYNAIVLRAFARFIALTGDKQILKTAEKLVRYIMKPRFWLGHIEKWGTDEDNGRKVVWGGHGGAVRKPSAHFKGHQSGISYALEALIDYGLVSGDQEVKSFVREGYEYMRNLGLATIGMWGENIINGYMAMIGIKLSDAGAGEYWEDVDQYVRNAIVEDQHTDAEALRQLCEERGHVPTEADGYTIERFLGSLRHDGLIDRNGTLDPTQNGTDVAGPYQEHLYGIWESIVRDDDELTTVNLLLNRASRSLDIGSHLPYRGLVEINNKSARSIAVRIPLWVDKRAVTCRVDRSACSFQWLGNYALVRDLKGKREIRIEFPMKKSTREYYLTGFHGDENWFKRKEEFPRYVLHFKGNTCIKVEFPDRERFFKSGQNHVGCPVYQRGHYQKDEAPRKRVSRYVSPRLASW